MKQPKKKYKSSFELNLSEKDAKMLAYYAKKKDTTPLTAIKRILRETLEKEFEDFEIDADNQLDLFDAVQMNIFDAISSTKKSK